MEMNWTNKLYRVWRDTPTLGIRSWRNVLDKYSRRNYCTPELSNETAKENDIRSHSSPTTQNVPFRSFDDMIESRRSEAKRSVLIEIQNISSCSNVLSICKSYTRVKNSFFYSVHSKHYVLVEFLTEKHKRSILEKASHALYMNIIPVTSPFLWFRENSKMLQSSKTYDYTPDTISSVVDMEELRKQGSIANEMQYLYERTKISDISSRLRFFTCHQLELALSGIFPSCRALPFGSSVNGFGRNSGDLDIFFQCYHNLEKDRSCKDLMYHAKSWSGHSNTQLKFMADLFSIMLPGCSDVRSIMGARVPIIKYQQTMTNMDCDIQNSSISGVNMTHLLWIMSNWDERVSPLVYTIRAWAHKNTVTTDKKPSLHITNFNLILMIIYYLQQVCVLPTMNFLHNCAVGVKPHDPNDESIFSYWKDVHTLPDAWSKTNYDSIQKLLLGFFEFYVDFNFDANELSIISGKPRKKRSNKPLWIVNPCEPELNASYNVSKEKLSTFISAARMSKVLLTDKQNKSANTKTLLAILPNHFPTKTEQLAIKELSRSSRKKTTGQNVHTSTLAKVV